MSYASFEIERLRAERDDLMKANALLRALISNREAEIEQLRAIFQALRDDPAVPAWIQTLAAAAGEGREHPFVEALASLTKTCLSSPPTTPRELTKKEAAAEIERLRTDKDVILSHNAAFDILEIGIDLRDAEIERLRAALMEIRDNGYRAALCHAVAKTALEQKSP
jgi:hypothetical protein